MIIKSHIRGGFRDAAAYLKEQGQNEVTRLVEISDPHAKTLGEAFRAMWAVADGTKVKKALHHVSINPMKDERLTDKQVQRICERLEKNYGYTHGEHQRVIVEHIKEGRQHFHVIWNRVSLATGKPHYPYKHKMQSKITAREMEAELGLKRITSRAKARNIKFGFSFARHTQSLRRSYSKQYACLLGETTLEPPRKKKGRKGEGSGGNTGDGSDGGMGSMMSALQTIPLQQTTKTAAPVKDYMGGIGNGNGPERRHKKMWVGVERRQNKL